MRKENRHGLRHKATEMEPQSPCLATASKRGNSPYRRLGGLSIAAVFLIVPILTLHKTPVAARAPENRSGNGASAPWEKTGGPPGLTANVIFKANNIVYAGTETQGIYKSTDNGLSWIPANAGIERASISDIIVSGTQLVSCRERQLPHLLKYIQVH